MIYPLYIDPGTGSALFSILIGAAAAVYFLFRAFFIKFKFYIFGGRGNAASKKLSPYVIYCEAKHYWNVFKPIVDEFESRSIELLYLTSAHDDPIFKMQNKFVEAQYIGEGNKAFARLNFLSAGVVLMTTPGLDVFQMKRSKTVNHYAHILHASSDATMYSMFGIDYFDSVLLCGDYQSKDIRCLEQMRNLGEKQLPVVGCTYLDVSLEKIKNLPKEENHTFTVLVSPSWGSSALLSKYGKKLLDPLIQTGWRIIVRPHPQSKKSESEMLNSLTTYYNTTPNLEWDYENENIFSMSKADIMISDFSGIIYDYTFLFDKPIMYVNEKLNLDPYDAGFLEEELWQFKTLRKIGIELKEEEFASIGEIIKKASCSNELKEARSIAKKTAWQHQGEAGKRAVDFMIAQLK
ncbi:MAG: CDP-glycerol glycerophosphotransferase family protein [Termitinemataceae bacterium]|nr:MAG: CDP-glycerol glycerophosphotransferase family protein [Termitinemataceae bacterium]